MSNISPLILCDVLEYYDTDNVINACETFITQRVFNRIPAAISESVSQQQQHKSAKEAVGTVPAWSVQWVFGSLRSFPSIFNTPPFLNALSLFLRRARVHVRVFGFVAYWYHKDIAKWVRECLREASDLTAVVKQSVPFGVLEPNEYKLELNGSFINDLTRGASVTLMNKAMDANIACDVYIHDLQLIPVTQWHMEGAISRQENAHPNRLLSDRNGFFMPRSVFYGLHDERLLLDEAQLNMWDADFTAAHPRIILAQQPPSNLQAALSNPSDQALYTNESLLEAASREAIAAERYAYNEAIDTLFNTLRHHGLLVEKDRTGFTPREERRRMFRRPDIGQDLLEINEPWRVANVQQAHVINDYAYAHRIYVQSVRSHMGMSHNLSVSRTVDERRHRKTTSKDPFESVNDFSGLDVAFVEELVKQERDVLTSIFDTVWTRTFKRYDMRLVSETIDLIAQRVEAVAVAAMPSTESLFKQMVGGEEVVGESPPNPKQQQQQKRRERRRQQTEDEDGDVEERRRNNDDKDDGLESARVTLATLRKILKDVLHNSRATAQLIFQEDHSRKTREQLNIMLHLYDRGIVSVDELERPLHAVIGHHVKLEQKPDKKRKHEDDDEKVSKHALPPEKKKKKKTKMTKEKGKDKQK